MVWWRGGKKTVVSAKAAGQKVMWPETVLSAPPFSATAGAAGSGERPFGPSKALRSHGRLPLTVGGGRGGHGGGAAGVMAGCR